MALNNRNADSRQTFRYKAMRPIAFFAVLIRILPVGLGCSIAGNLSFYEVNLHNWRAINLKDKPVWLRTYLMLKIVIIDKDPLIHQTLAPFLPHPRRIFTTVVEAKSLFLIRQHDPQLIFLGSNIAKNPSLEMLEKIHATFPNLLIVYMHPNPDHHLTMKVMRAGAYYLLHKPNDFPELASYLQPILHHLLNKTPSMESEEKNILREIVGNSSACKKMKENICRLAPLDVTVLIQGESGSGKELVARALHRLSKRKDFPFIPVNCGALPLTLYESELFGSCRGAYTEAINRKGYFEQSQGGTIFLDEITEMCPAAQVKLLRVLEEKRITPLGSSKSIPVNTRILTATNSNLPKRVSTGRFREDLLFRINTAIVTVPPLRKRREDIPLLSEYFLREAKFLSTQKTMSPNTLEKLSRHDWPGNIRELRNVMERASINCPGSIIRPHHVTFFKLKP